MLTSEWLDRVEESANSSRSHAPRGNARSDALRLFDALKERACVRTPERPRRSAEAVVTAHCGRGASKKPVPTQSVGTSKSSVLLEVTLDCSRLAGLLACVLCVSINGQ